MMASWEGDLAAATIDPEVFALRPDYVAVLIVARGLVPGDPSVASEEALCEAETVAAQALEGVEAHDLPTIAPVSDLVGVRRARPDVNDVLLPLTPI